MNLVAMLDFNQIEVEMEKILLLYVDLCYKQKQLILGVSRMINTVAMTVQNHSVYDHFT